MSLQPLPVVDRGWKFELVRVTKMWTILEVGFGPFKWRKGIISGAGNSNKLLKEKEVQICELHVRPSTTAMTYSRQDS